MKGRDGGHVYFLFSSLPPLKGDKAALTEVVEGGKACKDVHIKERGR